jgi:lipopolysaccharide export LptBFGC system permease protein LptF
MGVIAASGGGTMNLLLTMILAALSAALVPRRRLRSGILGIIVLLMFVTGISGCGNSGIGGATPPGTYSLVVKGTSGTIMANANITLRVTGR